MIQPLHTFVVLKEIKKEISKTIIVLENADVEQSNVAEVVAVGEEVKASLKKGDKVLIQRYGFDEIEVEKEKLLIGKEDNIIAKC